jgi:hypothetical protein
MQELLLQSIGRALPGNFVRTLASDVEWAYKEAFAASFQNPLLDEHEANYQYPHYRRSILEKRVRDSAGAAGLSAEIRPNHVNNYHFTEISAGDWIFTLKHTSDEKHMLTSSIFREQSAALNGLLDQLTMPAILGGPDQRPHSKFSAIIFHATDRQDKSTPGFIRIGIPREDFLWWEAVFDIHELLLVQEAVRPTEDDIQVVAKWKERAKRNASQ